MYLYIIIAVCVGSIVAQNAKRGRAKTLDTLMKRSAKYATMAQQDGSPLHSVVHANHASAYLTAAKEHSLGQEAVVAEVINDHVLTKSGKLFMQS